MTLLWNLSCPAPSNDQTSPRSEPNFKTVDGEKAQEMKCPRQSRQSAPDRMANRSFRKLPLPFHSKESHTCASRTPRGGLPKSHWSLSISALGRRREALGRNTKRHLAWHNGAKLRHKCSMVGGKRVVRIELLPRTCNPSTALSEDLPVLPRGQEDTPLSCAV